MLIPTSCSKDGCRYCERRESCEKELHSQEDVFSAVEVASPFCCESREIDTTGWRWQQEEDANLQPVLHWLRLQQPPMGTSGSSLPGQPRPAKIEALQLPEATKYVLKAMECFTGGVRSS